MFHLILCHEKGKTVIRKRPSPAERLPSLGRSSRALHRGSSGNNSATGSSVPGTKGEKGLRIETWNAGWIRYMIPCWELEEEGDLIYLPLDGEGTYIYIVGTQLMAGMQIPVREPDFISWAIEVRPAGICKGLVSPHCLLEVDMGWVPDSLARPELVVHSWNVKRFFHPGEQRGLVAEYAVQRCESRGGLPEGVLCILGPGKETVPTVLVVIAVGQDIPLNFLNLPLSLAIGLGVVSGGQAYRDA